MECDYKIMYDVQYCPYEKDIEECKYTNELEGRLHKMRCAEGLDYIHFMNQYGGDIDEK